MRKSAMDCDSDFVVGSSVFTRHVCKKIFTDRLFLTWTHKPNFRMARLQLFFSWQE